LPRSRGSILLALLGLVLAADACVLVIDGRAVTPVPAFQHVTRGVGLGPALGPAWSFRDFDPRLEPACENELWPLPGLACPNPVHGCRLVDLQTPHREATRTQQ
jgi:hypothetical protein